MLTMLYHTREEMEVMHGLVQKAIDDCPACAGKVRGAHHITGCPGFQMLNSLRTMWAEAMYGAASSPPVVLATSVKLTLTNLDHLVESAGSVEAAQQLRDLRQHLINENMQLRRRAGLEV